MADTVDEDRDHLHSMGYAQELHRGMSTFSNFAISFSIISILAGGMTSFWLGMVTSGPRVITPVMRVRVVCGLEVTMATFSPTRRLVRLDLPTLGRPTKAMRMRVGSSSNVSVLPTSGSSFTALANTASMPVRCADDTGNASPNP